MKERPILFSAPMVRADLEDRKTATRRAMKPQPELVTTSNDVPFGKAGHHSSTGWVWRGEQLAQLDEQGFLAHCPYGQVGDRLWVKETFFAWGRWETRYSAKKGRDEWHFVDMTLECGKDYLYAADGVSNTQAFVKRRSSVTPVYWKRPAIFMPRAASRITLEVTGVRVERLQAISEADAIAEGMNPAQGLIGEDDLAVRGVIQAHDERDGTFLGMPAPVARFVLLWDSINGKHPGVTNWNANPLVWVVSFKRVTP